MLIQFSQTILIHVFKHLLRLTSDCFEYRLVPVQHDLSTTHYFFILSKYSSISEYFRSCFLATISNVIQCDNPVLDLVANYSAVSTLFRYISPHCIKVKSNTSIVFPFPTHLITSLTLDFCNSYTTTSQIDWEHLSTYYKANNFCNLSHLCFSNAYILNLNLLTTMFSNIISLEFYNCSFRLFCSNTDIIVPQTLSQLKSLSVHYCNIGESMQDLKKSFTIDVSNLRALKVLSISSSLRCCIIGLSLLPDLKNLSLECVTTIDELHPGVRLDSINIQNYYANTLNFEIYCQNFENCQIVLQSNMFPLTPLYKFLLENSIELTMLVSKESGLGEDNGVFHLKNSTKLTNLIVKSSVSDLVVDISDCSRLDCINVEMCIGSQILFDSSTSCLFFRNVSLECIAADLVSLLLSKCFYLQSLKLAHLSGNFAKPFLTLNYLQSLSVFYVDNFFELYSVFPRLRFLHVKGFSDLKLSLFPVLVTLNLKHVEISRDVGLCPNFTIQNLSLDKCSVSTVDFFSYFTKLNCLYIDDMSLKFPRNVRCKLPQTLKSLFCRLTIYDLHRFDFSSVNLVVLSGGITFFDEHSKETAQESVKALGSMFSDLVDGLVFVHYQEVQRMVSTGLYHVSY
ncbi:hypothetical protein RCL1_002531 [Eukaryota sp. TZLM3-RCL]